VWAFTGDGPTQKCGLRLTISGLTFRLRAFLENSTGTGAVADTGASQEIVLTIDNTAPNNYLLIGGEFGVYVESGRDGLPNNLGQGFIGTFLPIPEFYGSKDAQRKWSAQGFCCDLTGNLKFSTGRDGTANTFITNDGTNRVFSACFNPRLSRGTTSLYANTQVNNPYGVLSHRKVLFGSFATGQITTMEMLATFGSAWLAGNNNGRYAISGLLFAPSYNMTAVSSPNFAPAGGYGIATGTTTSAGQSSYGLSVDPSAFWRKVEKFAQVDYTLTAWANITDAVSGLAYRVINVADGGRTAKLAVEWPSIANIVTISL